jgi:hypothetical protein
VRVMYWNEVDGGASRVVVIGVPDLEAFGIAESRDWCGVRELEQLWFFQGAEEWSP